MTTKLNSQLPVAQIVDIPDKLIEDHDLTVDYIVTPKEIIKCNRTRAKPSGIIWSKLEPQKVCNIGVTLCIMCKVSV